MKADRKYPNEPRIWLFAKIVDKSHLPFFRQIKLFINLLFVEVAPGIPVSLKRSFTGAYGKKAAIIGFTLAFIFCLLVNVAWTFFNGTLFGSQKNVIYFLDDYSNLAFYSLICPLYVGLTCWLVVVVVKGWGEINKFKSEEVAGKESPSKFKLLKSIFLGTLIFSVALALTANYINDIMLLANKKEPNYYWFLNENHNLGALGVYYFLLNYSLLVITLVALTCFMSMFSLVMDVGSALESKQSPGALNFDKIKNKLSAFTEAYLITKWLVTLYMVNIFVWAKSPLGTTDNLEIAAFLISLIGVFMLSIPRYFLELQWYRLKNRTNTETIDDELEDIRPLKVKTVVMFLDSLMIGGFIFSFWSDYFI